MDPAAPFDVLKDAAEAGHPVRMHLHDGEVVLARVLHVDRDEVVYAALQSSHPERYAVCDSTGARARLEDVERAIPIKRTGAPRKRSAQ